MQQSSEFSFFSMPVTDHSVLEPLEPEPPRQPDCVYVVTRFSQTSKTFLILGSYFTLEEAQHRLLRCVTNIQDIEGPVNAYYGDGCTVWIKTIKIGDNTDLGNFINAPDKLW